MGQFPETIERQSDLPKVNIDYKVFKKTDKEKGELLTMKKAHQKELRAEFGTKRPYNTLNIPSKQMGKKFVAQF